jgi:hypothetical protein
MEKTCLKIKVSGSLRARVVGVRLSVDQGEDDCRSHLHILWRLREGVGSGVGEGEDDGHLLLHLLHLSCDDPALAKAKEWVTTAAVTASSSSSSSLGTEACGLLAGEEATCFVGRITRVGR